MKFVQCEPNQSNENGYVSGRVLRSGVLHSSSDALTFDDIRIGHLFTDHFNGITIYFVITSDSLFLRKYSLIQNQLCLIEQVPLKPVDLPDDQWKINRAEFIFERVNRSSSLVSILVLFCF